MRVSNWDEEFVIEARRQFDDKRCRIEGRRKRESYAVNAPVTKIDGVLGAANALLRGGATESFVARLERREKELERQRQLLVDQQESKYKRKLTSTQGLLLRRCHSLLARKADAGELEYPRCAGQRGQHSPFLCCL